MHLLTIFSLALSQATPTAWLLLPPDVARSLGGTVSAAVLEATEDELRQAGYSVVPRDKLEQVLKVVGVNALGAAPTGDLPSATLDAGSAGTLEGGAGTHCWASGGAGRCVDFVGPVTNVDPVAVAPGQALTLDFEAGAPLELAVSWYEVAGARSEVNVGARVWHNVFEGFIAPNLQPSGLSLDAPDRPGEYVLAVFSRWAMGDISYGFYLRVE